MAEPRLILYTGVYAKIREGFKNKKLLVLQGGSRSSKTYSICQYFIFKALNGEKFRITIARKFLSDAKSTVLETFKKVLIDMGVYNNSVTPLINKNRVEQTYTILNAEFRFVGGDEVTKIHGMEQDYAWINEAIECERKLFDQLEMRTNIAMIIDFNPIDTESWIYNLAKRDDCEFILSTVLDNNFAPESIRKKILGYEPTEANIENGTADEYMWNVYGLGLPAKLKGVIFKDWDEVDIIPERAKRLGAGLDFGFSVDPSSVIDLYILDNELYVDELIYETGLSDRELGALMLDSGITDSTLVVADSREPKSISELYSFGIYGIIGANKEAGSIRYGIRLLQSYKIHITKRSKNLIREFQKYKWREKRDGTNMKIPVDAFNHGIDALRYIASETLEINSNAKTLALSPKKQKMKYDYYTSRNQMPSDILQVYEEYMNEVVKFNIKNGLKRIKI